MAALLEQEPRSDRLQPLDKSAEPEAADAVALHTPASQASGSLGDGGYSSGYGSDGCSTGDGDGDGDGGCSSFGGSDSASGESGVDSTVSGGSGGASSGGAAVEGALPPVPLAHGGDSSVGGSPAGGSENGSAERHGGSPRHGSAGALAHVGASNIANPANPTAQQLMSGQVSFSDFCSRLQESTAGQAQSSVEERSRGAGSVIEAEGQDMLGRFNPSAKEEACCFLADLGCELQEEEAATETGKRSQGPEGKLMGGHLAEAPNGVHVGPRHVNVECDDPAPEADMGEDEYGDYEMDDDSGCSKDQPPQPLNLCPSALANVTFLQAFQPSQQSAALGMPPIPPSPTISQGQPQLAAEGAPGHGVLSWAQPAGYPGAESGSAHQSWKQGNHQSRGSRKRKSDEDPEEQNALQRRRLSGGTASNAQEGSAQQGAMSRCLSGELDAVASFEEGSTAVATGAAAEIAGGQAKQAGPAVAQLEPFASAGMFAHSSCGSPDVQPGVRDSPGVPSCYLYSF